MKKSILISALLAPPLLLAATPPAVAHPGHPGCQGFGELDAAEAHERVIGEEMRSLTPGTADDLVRTVHLGAEKARRSRRPA